MPQFVAFLRAVNVGQRTVAMTDARDVLSALDFADVASYANTGNLMFSSSGSASELERRVRTAMEERFGFELTTFVRTAAQVRTFVEERPFGELADGHTYFGLFTSTRLTVREKSAVTAMSNERDEVIVGARDVHWLIRAKSIETSLGPRRWLAALPDNPTTARNMSLLNRVARKL